MKLTNKDFLFLFSLILFTNPKTIRQIKLYLHLMKHKTQSQPFKPKPGAFEFVTPPAKAASTLRTTTLASLLCTTCDASLSQQTEVKGDDRVVFRD